MRKLTAILAAALIVAGCAGAAGTPAPGTAAPSVASSGTPLAPALPMANVLPAGTYSLDRSLGITIDVPSGWGTCCDSVIVKNDFAGLLYIDVTDAIVYTDPCLWQSGGMSEPRGAKAIAAALSAQRGRDGSQPRAVSVAGLPGMHVRLTVPADQQVIEAGGEHAFTGCDGGEFRSLTTTQDWTRNHQGASQIDDFYIVDVGSHTVVFDVASGPGIGAADMAALEAMVASVKIG
jgi:hypothetical protein